MEHDEIEVSKLSESLVDELVGAVGLPKNRFTHGLFRCIFRGITDRLAELGVPFDHITFEEGLPAGSAWGVSHFCNPAIVHGKENIPTDGPLLVAANHPGAYDGLVVFAEFIRQDIKWISSEIPFFRLLPHVKKHIIFSSREDSSKRMLVMREAVRHLKRGGTLVYFAAGHREPDPAVFPGAVKSIEAWLDIFDTLFKYVPGLQVMPVIMSGMITEKWSRHPIINLRRKHIDRQRLVEFGQVISQLLKPGKLMVRPNISFGKAFTESDLREEIGEGQLNDAVIAHSQALLWEHCRDFNLNPI